MAHLTYKIENQIAVITLNNPPQNRLSPRMIEEFDEALDTIGNSDARALLIRAEGPDFSFGGDIVPWPDMTAHELRTLLERYLVTFNRFESLSIPTVAAVQGLCFGGGLELAVRADVIFAGETARFGHPEQTLGIITVLGGVYRVAERAGRQKAIEWAFTSEQVPAKVMENHGVINRVVTDDKLFDEAMNFVEKLAKGPTRAHGVHKALLRIWAKGGLSAADQAVLELGLPLFESEDVKLALSVSVEAFKAGKPRPAFPFKGK
ncbi:enoyl-CoA hydratase-related protein [Neobacillus pocheonensis]|uniref:enoyl-CoA hydratase/isomerase family protein n=1 Tax=Bacillaceae TaxID=186817 RepID=UPI001C46004F|nr:enoyl-CoA hydratase/isomerase family protein [Bacillus sp. sid0103]MBV7507894.1 enoyl-CoA hydratase/isomerase family protein [Bacillus sp. sid0103]